MKPLLIALSLALSLGALGAFAYFAQLSKYEPSVRSMVANEERQGHFLLTGFVLLIGAALVIWLA